MRRKRGWIAAAGLLGAAMLPIAAAIEPSAQDATSTSTSTTSASTTSTSTTSTSTTSTSTSTETATTMAVEALTMEQAVERAVDRSLLRPLLEAELHRAQALLKQAQSTLGPAATLNAQVTQLDGDRKAGDRVFAPATSGSVQLQGSWPLLALGREAAVRRAADQAGVAQASAADVRRQAALAAGRAYLAVVAQNGLVAQARRAREIAGRFVAHVRRRVEGGVGRAIDLRRAELDEATTEALLAQAEGALDRAREALGVVTGSDGPIDAAPGATPLASPAEAEATTPSVLSDRRTDLAAARQRVEAAERAMERPWLDQMPLITLQGQAGSQVPGSVVQPPVSFQMQLVLSLPLWDSGLREAQQAERAALAEASRAQQAQLLRQVAGEQRTALAAVKHADAALEAARRAHAQAEEILRVMSEARDRAGVTAFEVVDAQQRERLTAAALVAAEDQARQARLELLAAAGLFPGR